MFKVCFRCPECGAEMEVAFIPHYESNLHLSKDLKCFGVPRLTLVASIRGDDRGEMKRGWVPREDYENGTEWAVDGEWKNPPPGTMQVAIIPLPEEYWQK